MGKPSTPQPADINLKKSTMISISIDHKTVIRQLALEDAEALLALVDDDRAHLRQWLPWVDGTQTLEDQRGFIEMGLAQHRADNGFHAGIWYENRLAGTIGIHYLDRKNRSTSIGYWLHSSVVGHGLATQASRALISHLFHVENMNRVEITCAVDNHRSRAIPLRLGAKEEGVRRQCEWLYDHFVDHVIYSIIAAEWTG